MTDFVDQPRSVRTGEELSAENLDAYLRQHLADYSGNLEILQFPGGYSNLTYLVRTGEGEFILRRPPFGANIKSAHDMSREYRVLSGLQGAYGKVPKPVIYCEDEAVIGAPFYLMERVNGVILRANPPKELDLSSELMNKLSHTLVENLVDLHRVDIASTGLSDLGRGENYTERQITGWTKRYRNAQTDEIPEMDTLIEWLNSNIPPDSGITIIHNDYKYDNLVLDENDLTNILAVLDWEMCTLGDPLMDLGTTLGYWIEASDPPELQMMFGLTSLPGNMTREEIVDNYQKLSGRSFDNALFYYLYGVFKIAGIIQQIYARYKKGHTQDPRFAPLIYVVKACAKLAITALEKGHISNLG